MDKYQVIVGNIGTVYSGGNYRQASRKFTTYVEQSKERYGRAAGENVTFLCDGEIEREHVGYLSKVDPELAINAYLEHQHKE